MPYRKRKRQQPRSVKKVPLHITEQEVESPVYIADVVKAFNLHQYQQLSWQLTPPTPELSEEEREQLFTEISLCFPTEYANQDIAINVESTDTEEKWYLFSKLHFEGNLIGLSNILTSSNIGNVSIKLQWWSQGTVSLCVHTHLPEPASIEQVISRTTPLIPLNLYTTVEPLFELDKQSVRELTRLSRLGGVRLIAINNITRLTVSIFVGDLLMNEEVPDNLPVMKSGHLMKDTLFQSLYPNILSDPAHPHHLEVDESLGEELSANSSGYRAKIFQFYKWVRTHQLRLLSKELSPLPSAIPDLTSDLMDFQKRAVQWMLYKEQADGWFEENEDTSLHVLWREVPIEDQPTLYYNPFTGKFSNVPIPSSQPPKGGILADEMGLGKTVEVLALILTHRWSGNLDKEIETYIKRPDESMETETVNNTIEDDSKLTEGESTKMEVENTSSTQHEESSDHQEITNEINRANDMGSTSCRKGSSPNQSGNDIVCDDPALPSNAKDVGPGNVETVSICDENVEFSERENEEVIDVETAEVRDNQIDVISLTSKTDAISCICGASNDKYGDLFVQCQQCLIWQHAHCTDYDSKRRKEFICIKCLLKKPISCGTSLIIVPDSLLHQWLEEIAKHTNMESLSILVYEGVFKQYLNPILLASHDIILVTYETLRRELDRVHHHEFLLKLRYRKHYSYPPSPLLGIQWWRVCLDEAQIVETSNSKAAEMTHKLSAVNRWCVTGTPVQRDLRDLYGLVYFLECRPYSIHHWWEELIWRPYCKGRPQAMIALFSQLMWRNSKEDVTDELNWPERHEKNHRLKFSAVESYYYQRQEEICTSTFSNIARQVTERDVTLSELHRSLITKLLRPLHTLRLACCHPQLVKRGYINFNISKKSYLTMNDLLKKMIVQAKQEGRESLRQLVSAFNGSAAIHILQKNYQSAVDNYREAMEIWKNHENSYECDKLQRIHTMENLSSLLKEGHSANSRAISDDQLDTLAADLRSQYMKKQEGQVEAAVQTLCIAATKTRTAKTKAFKSQSVYLGDETQSDEEHEDISDDVISSPSLHDDSDIEEDNDQQETEDQPIEQRQQQDIKTQQYLNTLEHFTVQLTIKPPNEFWWSSVISWAIESLKDKELYSTLENELYSSPDYLNQLTFVSFNSLTGFQYAMITHIDKLETERVEILISLKCLSQPPSPSLISAATQCHLKTNRINPSDPCDYCETESAIKNYEGLLFSRYQIRAEETDTSRSMSVYERMLKCLLSFVSSKGGPNELCVAGVKLLSYFDSLRKEFKYITRLWMATEQHVKACDELTMAAKRFTLLSPEEEKELSSVTNSDPFILSRGELVSKLLQFMSDVSMAKRMLRKNVQQLTYLQNLTKIQEEETPTCPICAGQLDKNQEWAVLPCGHSFCTECLYTLLCHHYPTSRSILRHSLIDEIETAINRRVHFHCPMCRESLFSDKINYIRGNVIDDEVLPPLQGSYSTKVTAVTGTLLKIQQEDNQTKSIVFSSNAEVLKLISHALNDNHINYALLLNKKDFQKNLHEFKTSSSLNVLLMPMSSGSKGLNIVEATHVLLVEPSLNLGAELQAIGRVHRMGQTKDTTVHRFYVGDSIEQRIKELMCNTGDIAKFLTTSNISDVECNFTLTELQRLFLSSHYH